MDEFLKRFKNVKGAIFDLDGTLIDSMNVWRDIDIEFFAKHGLVYEDSYQKAIGHKGLKEIAKYTKETYSLEESEEEIVSIWLDMAKDYYENKINLKPGVKDFLQYLKSNNIKIGLATSNSLELSLSILKRHGIYSYFDKILTVNELKADKSSPLIYLNIASSFDLVPSECLVFEDLLIGIKTAKEAGFITIGVEDECSLDKKKEIKNIASCYIKDFFSCL
ncbi:MAG TPA: HAD family hydrolase [Firmicutes bacterium]|nr:HAD family hydrolase [Bacillota bacterium]